MDPDNRPKIEFRHLLDQIPYPPDPSIMQSNDRSQRPPLSTLRPEQDSFSRSPYDKHPNSLKAFEDSQPILNPEQRQMKGYIGEQLQELREENNRLRGEINYLERQLERVKVQLNSSSRTDKILDMLSTNLELSVSCEWQMKCIKGLLSHFPHQLPASPPTTHQSTNTDQLPQKALFDKMADLLQRQMQSLKKAKGIMRMPIQMQIELLSAQETVKVIERLNSKLRGSVQIQSMLRNRGIDDNLKRRLFDD